MVQKGTDQGVWRGTDVDSFFGQATEKIISRLESRLAGKNAGPTLVASR
jgi:hypothetical protein